MPRDRVVLFRLFSQLYKFSLSSINFLFQIDWPFELYFISITFISTHSRQIGEYLTKEIWDIDLLVCQEGRGDDKFQFSKYWDFGSEYHYKDK